MIIIARCPTCQKEIEVTIGKQDYADWLKLLHYFEFELAQDDITEKTFETLVDALMTLKPEEADD